MYILIYTYNLYISKSQLNHQLPSSFILMRVNHQLNPRVFHRIPPREGTASSPCGASQPEFLESTGQSLVQTQRRGKRTENNTGKTKPQGSWLTLRQRMMNCGVQSPKRNARYFRFQYHSEKVSQDPQGMCMPYTLRIHVRPKSPGFPRSNCGDGVNRPLVLGMRRPDSQGR